MQTIHADEIKRTLGTRDRDTHKGDYGKVLVVAGSAGMAGAAVLAGRGAYVSGAGLVTVALPEGLFPIVQISLPEAICIPRKPGKMDFLQYDAIVIGPGLGIHRDNGSILEDILKTYEGPLVIDADGLNCIGEYDLYQALLDTKANVVVTPHPGEGRRLLGVGEIGDRAAFAATLARTLGVTAVLKGAGTLIASVSEDGQCNLTINNTGNPGMATAGSGDVLAGMIGAFLAAGMSAQDASIAGVHIHGAAGDLAAMALGETGLMATDICRHIPYAIKNITGK